MAVESSAFSHEQKNKFLLCSTGSRVCTHSLYVLCSPLSLFCWFSSPPEIGRVEEGSRKRKKRSHEKSQQIPNSPSPHRQLYIYINISRPYPRALFYFFFFDLSRADRCWARISYFYGSTPLSPFFFLYPNLRSLQGTLGGGAVVHQLSLIFRRSFLRVVNWSRRRFSSLFGASSSLMLFRPFSLNPGRFVSPDINGRFYRRLQCAWLMTLRNGRGAKRSRPPLLLFVVSACQFGDCDCSAFLHSLLNGNWRRRFSFVSPQTLSTDYTAVERYYFPLSFFVMIIFRCTAYVYIYVWFRLDDDDDDYTFVVLSQLLVNSELWSHPLMMFERQICTPPAVLWFTCLSFSFPLLETQIGALLVLMASHRENQI